MVISEKMEKINFYSSLLHICDRKLHLKGEQKYVSDLCSTKTYIFCRIFASLLGNFLLKKIITMHKNYISGGVEKYYRLDKRNCLNKTAPSRVKRKRMYLSVEEQRVKYVWQLFSPGLGEHAFGMR